jgi:hypothetical protein
VSFHESILTSVQVRVLRALGPLAKSEGFYLAGGTAVALRFGHRRSVDFDWFAPTFDNTDTLTAEIAKEGLTLNVSQVEAGTIIGSIDSVKISFFQYRYPLVNPLEFWLDFGIDIASVRDLQAMKLLAIAQRGSRKDFVDVHELLQQGTPLRDMLQAFDAKFSTDRISVLRGLTYFDDAEAEPMPEMLNAREWKTVRSDITRAVRDFMA